MKNKILIVAMTALTTAFNMSCETENLMENENDVVANAEAKAVGPWQKVFNDQFNAGGNLNKWQKTNRPDYNSANCNYQSGNPKIGSLDNASCLVLTATKSGNKYYSGHVKSNYSFKPGINQEFRVYARIKLIAKQGTTFKGFNETYGAWPAFWTVQENQWPKQGEIDILEGYSFAGSARFASNLFYGANADQNQLGRTAEREYNVSEGWHNYNEYWKNVNGNVTVTIVVDGSTKATYTNATNSNLRLQNFGPHNIIFNLNVGSNPALNLFDASRINLFSNTQMYVDWVQVDKRTL